MAITKHERPSAIMPTTTNTTATAPAPNKTILVTGGAGFIGSHTCVELIEAGYNAVVIDDFSNSSPIAIERVRTITNATDAQLALVEGSILGEALLNRIFEEYNPTAIIHFAGFKSVGESVAKPLEYYHNNIVGTLRLCDAARTHGCKNLVFSSSATVYGEPAYVPIDEECPKRPATNPYGWSKSMIEQILIDLHAADHEWSIVLLRYFNPVGAHPSGLIGEDPKGIPNNLMPYVAKVASGELPFVKVFGDDYPTPDGTGIRDYIHVVDLARGHIAALNWMEDFNETSGSTEQDIRNKCGVEIFNLGTGRGSSVFDVINAYSNACGRELPHKVLPRREGDIAACYASCDKATRILNWHAKYELNRMCIDSWHWQSANPNGYASKKGSASAGNANHHKGTLTQYS